MKSVRSLYIGLLVEFDHVVGLLKLDAFSTKREPADYSIIIIIIAKS